MLCCSLKACCFTDLLQSINFCQQHVVDPFGREPRHSGARFSDFEQVHAAFNGGGHQARPQRMRAESCRIERQTRRAGLHDVSHDASGEPLSADTLRSPVQYPPE
jgi:hypothetical protein